MTTLPREPSSGEFDDGVISLRACVRREHQDDLAPATPERGLFCARIVKGREQEEERNDG